MAIIRELITGYYFNGSSQIYGVYDDVTKNMLRIEVEGQIPAKVRIKAKVGNQTTTHDVEANLSQIRQIAAIVPMIEFYDADDGKMELRFPWNRLRVEWSL